MRGLPVVAAFVAWLPVVALAQSASEVERCFQNPAACSTSGPAAPSNQAGAVARPAPAPDHASVLQGSEGERRKIQESLRTLDKYPGPIDGNLQSPATVKAIGDWQKGRGAAATGKLTPEEAKALNEEAAKVPIKRIEPAPQQVATPTPAPASPSSNADALKALQERLAARRKAAEPKADAAIQALVRDLKAYVAADGKGLAGDQFPAFAKWYAETKTAGRSVGDINPAIDDYGDAKDGAATTAEVLLQGKQGDVSVSQCLVFAWVEGNPRKNPQAFSCDDIAAVEKWKTERALRSAWR
ncbi:MAG: peptidoglycan-binding protein [Enhydrobacter sp.]|nr:MAG: peptidoglycan-binding protein [Enhydrobacter sp.]